MKAWTLIIFSLASILSASAQQCGSQVGGALCPNCLCCSQWGFCGSGDAWCGTGCQSQCDLICAPPPPPPPPSPPPPPYTPPPPPTPCGELTSLISRELFEQMLLHRNNAACPARGFYTYDDFIAAAKSFEGFAQGDDSEICKREIAAFLGQTSHETTGGWDGAPDGRFAWGYCFKEEVGASGSPYCVPSVEWPCVPGKMYFGRGPIQISYNYNYGQAGQYLGVDLLSNPDLVASDGLLSFKTAFWFWMTPQAPKPSCHDVMTGKWTPSPIDIAAGRLPGYGLCTNIINGGLECGGTGPDLRVESRIGFYKRYCDLLGVSYGDNLDCYNMNPYGFGLSSVHANQVLDPVM